MPSNNSDLKSNSTTNNFTSANQSSWLQTRRPVFDSRNYQKKVVGLERDPHSLVSTTEELLDRKAAPSV
jgi:hypothetical protein